VRFQVLIKRKSVDAINELPGKTRRIIHDALGSLEQDPYPGAGGDKELLHHEEGIEIYRLHIGRSYTAFYTIDIPSRVVQVHDIMTIGQAHKKYGRI
jgi:mRNA-degrading endonuclease RelE of RelBE toxin-antitoxin system